MSNGYFNYNNLDSFLKEKKKINGNIKISNEDQKKYKLKIILMKKRKMKKKKILRTPIKVIISLKQLSLMNITKLLMKY